MIDKGKVVKIKGDDAEIKVDKRDECSKCGMCLFSEGAKATTFTAVNLVGAKEGDEVLIDIKRKGKMLAIFLVFIIPILLIGASVTFSLLVIKDELWAIIISAGLIMVWYVILALIDKKVRKKSQFAPVILKVIDKKEN